MKKRFAMITAAVAGTMMISLTGITASAAQDQVDEQYVTVDDGQTVVYIITYVEPDDIFVQQTVSWYDAGGTKYVHTYKARPQQDGFSSYVTWYDASGNKYVLDQNAQTVTIYDADGNLIAVRPA